MPDAAEVGPVTRVDTLVVGAGLGGLAAAIQLLRAGLGTVLVIEQASDVGGTWLHNTYPGCACDVPAHLYSLSFAPRASWSRLYATQPELLDYARDVARRSGVDRHIRFGTRLARAAWDEAALAWRATTQAGGTIIARAIVSAIGALHVPHVPAIAGAEDFAGTTFHSASWPSDFDPRGKRVAVIGTGASAIQFVPRVQPDVAHLDLFQRTPPWILPKPDRPFSPAARSRMRLGFWRRAFRARLYWQHEVRAAAFLGRGWARARAERMALAHLESQVSDLVLRRKLKPDYAIGCKRVLIANDYYPALTQENVELVTTPIARILPDGVMTQDGTTHPADVIIHGTGFLATDPYAGVEIVGRGGRTLAEVWRDGMEAFWGTSIAGFPNFFTLLGPNTGLGHNSVVLMIEAQIGHIVSVLRRMRAAGAGATEPRAEAQRAFNERLRGRMKETVWLRGGCRSWYLDAAGRNTTIWPGYTFRFIRQARRASPGDYATYLAT